MRLLPALICSLLLSPLRAQDLEAIEMDGATVTAVEGGHRYTFEDGASIEIAKVKTTPGEDPLELPLLLAQEEGLAGFEVGRSRKTWHHMGRHAFLCSARTLTHGEGRSLEERRFMLPTIFGTQIVHARTTPEALDSFLRAHYPYIVFDETSVFVGAFNVHVPTGPQPRGYYRQAIGVELTLPGDLTTSLILRGEKTEQDAFAHLRSWIESEMKHAGSSGKTSRNTRLSFELTGCTGLTVIDRDAPTPLAYIAASRDASGQRLMMMAKVHVDDADTFTRYVTGRLEGAEVWGPGVSLQCVEDELGYLDSKEWSSWTNHTEEGLEQRLFTAGGEVKMRCGVYANANRYNSEGERSLVTRRERRLLEHDEFTVEDMGEATYELFGAERTATRLHYKWWTLNGGLDVVCWQNADSQFVECVLRALSDEAEDRTKKVREALSKR